MFRHSRTLASARLKERRRKAVIGKAVLALFFLGGTWLFAFWLTGLAVWNIRSIEVEGNTTLSSSAIASTTESLLSGYYFFTVPKKNIVFYPRRVIKDSLLETFPRLDTAEVGFKNLHTLGISVIERNAEALWCDASVPEKESCYLLDRSGFVFAPATGVSSRVFIKFYGPLEEEGAIGQTYIPAARFTGLLEFARQLGAFGFPVSAFRERPDGDMEASVSSGQRIVFLRDADLARVFENFQTVVSDPLFKKGDGLVAVDYLDLRFGNKVFYKLR